MLPGKFAQRFVTHRAPRTFQGVEGAADIAGQTRVIRGLAPLRINIVHGCDDFRQLFVKEFADFFIHDGIGMAANEGDFLGWHIHRLQIVQRFAGKIGDCR